MSYRHPNEIISNKEMLDECMHDAVRCGLNEVMPEVMSEFEEVIMQRFELMESKISETAPDIASPSGPNSFRAGLYMGLAAGSCLFIGLVAGLIIGLLV